MMFNPLLSGSAKSEDVPFFLRSGIQVRAGLRMLHTLWLLWLSHAPHDQQMHREGVCWGGWGGWGGLCACLQDYCWFFLAAP